VAIHTLNPPTLLALPQSFDMIFSQYVCHPEYKSLVSDGNSCKADSDGLLKRYPVRALEYRLIGKETERGWEQVDDISSLLPSLVRYRVKIAIPDPEDQETLQRCSLEALQNKTGLSMHTILRARRGRKLRTTSLQRLKDAARELLRGPSTSANSGH
jgi:hypothetical protein